MTRRAWLVLAGGCGGPPIEGLWALDEVSPLAASSSAAEVEDACMSVDRDLSGTLAITFVDGAENVVAFTVLALYGGRFRFDLPGDDLTCTLDDHDLDCELAPTGGAASTAFSFHRSGPHDLLGTCAQAPTPTTSATDVLAH